MPIVHSSEPGNAIARRGKKMLQNEEYMDRGDGYRIAAGIDTRAYGAGYRVGGDEDFGGDIGDGYRIGGDDDEGDGYHIGGGLEGDGFFGDLWNGIKKTVGVVTKVASPILSLIPHPAAQVAAHVAPAINSALGNGLIDHSTVNMARLHRIENRLGLDKLDENDIGEYAVSFKPKRGATKAAAKPRATRGKGIALGKTQASKPPVQRQLYEYEIA